jgi:hypothetical protein
MAARGDKAPSLFDSYPFLCDDSRIMNTSSLLAMVRAIPSLHGTPIFRTERPSGNFTLRLAIVPGAGVGSAKLHPQRKVWESVLEERT